MDRFLRFIPLILLFNFCLNASIDLDRFIEIMDPEDLERTGLSKLTEEEKKYFKFWCQHKCSEYHVKLPIVSHKEQKYCYKTTPFRGLENNILEVNDESQIPLDLAMCACFQHDAPYLREWIEYHKALSVFR